MKKHFLIIFLITSCFFFEHVQAMAPLGLFTAYDMNIRLKKPANGCFNFGILGEKSYKVKGYATNDCTEEVFEVNPLQIYEPRQNLIGLYQGVDPSSCKSSTLITPFTKLIDSIAGGPGGGVGNLQNGLFTPTGKFSAGQVAFHSTYSIGNGFYVSGYLPAYFVKLDCVDWSYSGNNTLFANDKIEQELVQTFKQDAQHIFNLDVDGWQQNGLGDIAVLVEWQKDFPQRRAVLKNVQPTLRLGLTLPTGKEANENTIMSTPFGSDGSVGIPFGGGLNVNLDHRAELGFSGQFWYFFSNEKERRIKSFSTQTSLLYPVVTNTIKEYAITQNFNLHAHIFSLCKRLTLKLCYQYWRQGDDTIYPRTTALNNDVVNSDQRIQERTKHNMIVAITYSPLSGEFDRYIPQAQIFWKGAFKGSRSAIASTAGLQLSVMF